MRVQAFRVWFTARLREGVGVARRAGLAVSRRIRQATGRVEINVGVGEDESRFGGSGSRAWIDLFEEAKARLLRLFEHSYFERFPRLERFLRRVLGEPKRALAETPGVLAPRAGRARLGAHSSPPPSSEEAARLRAQVRASIMRAHTSEHAGLRDHVSTHRKLAELPRSDEEDGGST